MQGLAEIETRTLQVWRLGLAPWRWSVGGALFTPVADSGGEQGVQADQQ